MVINKMTNMGCDVFKKVAPRQGNSNLVLSSSYQAGPGETVQHLRALASFAEVLSSISSIHIEPVPNCNFSANALFLLLWALQSYTYSHTSIYIHTHIIKNNRSGRKTKPNKTKYPMKHNLNPEDSECLVKPRHLSPADTEHGHSRPSPIC